MPEALFYERLTSMGEWFIWDGRDHGATFTGECPVFEAAYLLG